ncbi:MAG: TonB-dependent receptor [Bacteroidetes bacterium]|nr:TonB-dependent receptor [Bacteroidota bacterium]
MGSHKSTLIALLILLTSLLQAQQFTNGSIKGLISDFDSKQPLIGANVVILGTTTGAASDVNGNYTIANVSPGTYSLNFSYLGYGAKIKTDIVVKPGRVTKVDLDLKESSIETDSITVTGSFFEERSLSPGSIINYSYEEIRRAPGSAGDVSRILLSLPSVAKVNDQNNGLIVRGGSPLENGFIIDNIEVPNINHFPTHASSGGPIGMINVDFIKDVNFSSGGFSTKYGDKLSSIMELQFREGNKEEFNGQLDLNFSGFGFVGEGPFVSTNSSWLLSARRSYLDLLVKAIDIGTSIAPRYSDYQFKITFDLDNSNKLTFLGLAGDDESISDFKTAEENKMEVYGTQRIYEYTLGSNWRRIWGKIGYSNTSISFTEQNFNEDYFKAGTHNPILKNHSSENSIKIRNLNHFQIGKNSSFEFGIDGQYIFNNYNNRYYSFNNVLGNPVQEFSFVKNPSTIIAGSFTEFSYSPIADLTLTTGLRTDIHSYSENLTFDPRLAVTYKINDVTTLRGSAGIFHQRIPLMLLAQTDNNRKLSPAVATHFILGLDYLLTESTKLSVEIYRKNYSKFPVDESQPGLFIIDEIFYENIFYSFHENLKSKGKAVSYGIEVLLHKKLAENFYGLASASYFRSKYKAFDKIEYNRIFDNRIMFSIEGGYKPNSEWEFSLRWIFAGGIPYTPFDIASSKNANYGIIDGSKINDSRYPNYHSLNVRFDKRFSFEKTNLIFYLSVWNAYNQKNIAHYYWNGYTNKQDEIFQWMLLPIFGLEFEF